MSLITRRSWLLMITAMAVACGDARQATEKVEQPQVQTVTLAVDGMT